MIKNIRFRIDQSVSLSVLEGARIRVVKRSDFPEKELYKRDDLTHGKLFDPYPNAKYHLFTY